MSFNCSQVTGVGYQWTVSYRRSLSTRESRSVVFRGDERILRVPPNTLEPGSYYVIANVSKLLACNREILD